MVNFIKMNGLGNDFVIIDKRKEAFEIDSNKAKIISYRRFGIGCDQVILLEPSDKADIFMRIINADGGEISACGNATRCVGQLILNETGKPEVTIETRAGILKAFRPNGGTTEVATNMGEPSFDWKKIPLSADMDVLSLPIEMGPLANPVALSMGNPHMVFFVDDIESIKLRELGPSLEHHAFFPERCNVSIVKVESPIYLKMKIWERGVGKTLSCGTAACAALVAAVTMELCEAAAIIEQPGGKLRVEWLENGEVLMTGKTSTTFMGSFDEKQLFGR
jgi:diaminopimelate epimerase